MKDDTRAPILFIQIRRDPTVCAHETQSVLMHAGLLPDACMVADALMHPLDLSLLDRVRAVIIGGSGEFLISQGDIPEVMENVKDVVREARRRRMPTLGICFGGQIMTEAFGGRVEMDVSRQEVGTFQTTRTLASDRCPIFSRLPRVFDAQYGHKDHFTSLPSGAVLLASTVLSPFGAYTFPGESVYALVMHPELDEEAMAFRLAHYRDRYGVDQELYDRMVSAFRPSQDASCILRLFLSEVVEKGQSYPCV
jgi:GMP synthase-like glutamine amidotransferase